MVMTLETDYAVRIMELLTKTNGKVDAGSISESTHVPQRFALKILRKLVSDGLIVSFKGAHGGYALARPADQITLREVLESVQGPYMISRCQQDEYCCAHSGSGAHCRFHKVYDEVTEMVRKKLDSYTFAQICGSDDLSLEKDDNV